MCSALLSVGVGIDIDIGPILNVDICLCVNVLQLGTFSHDAPPLSCSLSAIMVS